MLWCGLELKRLSRQKLNFFHHHPLPPPSSFSSSLLFFLLILLLFFLLLFFFLLIFSPFLTTFPPKGTISFYPYSAVDAAIAFDRISR